jgi:hypothetical protein
MISAAHVIDAVERYLEFDRYAWPAAHADRAGDAAPGGPGR